jgi:glycosyltransferase involved in cell wall biosynthesis
VIALPFSFDLDPVTFFRALNFFKKDKPDLVLLNDQRECRIVAPAARLAGVRVRVQRKGWPFLKGSFRDRLVYRHAVTHLFAPSEAVAKIFRANSGLPPERVAVIANSVAPVFFKTTDRENARQQLGLPFDEPVIGTAGRLVTQKGFDLLIEAAGQLWTGGLRPWIVIAGDGPEKESLQNLAVKFGIRYNFLLAGQVADMPAFLAALDFFVFPSRQEGRSNALAEAMAAGLGIIASDIPGNDEMIENETTGLLVPPEDPAALARALARMLNDPGLAGRLGRAAGTWARDHLDEQKLLDILENYFRSLIGAGSGPGRK